MKNKIIRIDSQDKNIFYKILYISDAFCQKLNWKILFFEGTYKDMITIEIEKPINESIYGLPVSLIDVRELLDRVDELFDFLLIGQFGKKVLVQKSADELVLFNSSDMVIEYFDCTYWTFACSNSDLVNMVVNDLGKLYSIKTVFDFN